MTQNAVGSKSTWTIVSENVLNILWFVLPFLHEHQQFFKVTHGEKWKEEKEAIDKMKALRKYLVDELAKIDSQEQMCQ